MKQLHVSCILLESEYPLSRDLNEYPSFPASHWLDEEGMFSLPFGRTRKFIFVCLLSGLEKRKKHKPGRVF